MQFATEITIDGKAVILSIPVGSKAWRKANSIFCPLGPCWSTATFCMTKGQLDLLDLTATEEHSIVWKQIAQNDDFSPNATNTRTLTFDGWRFLRSSRVLPGGADDVSSLYLVEFVDARYIAEQATSTGPNRTKLRSYAHDADFLTNGAALTTWEALLGQLWADVGVLGSYPGLPGALPIDGEPEGHWLIGLNGWRALCAVLDLLDCAIVHNPLNANAYTIVQLGEAQTLPDVIDRLQWDSQPEISNIHCAETCRVHFYYHRKAYGQERDTELATNYVVIGASDVIDLPTGIDGATGTRFLWDDLPLVFDEVNSPTNAAACSTRAANRKARYVTRNTVPAKHKIYSGLLNQFLPGGQVRAVVWRNFDDGDINEFGGTCTEYICGPHLVKGYDGGEVVWFDKQLMTPENETGGPPDYGRHTYPNYPRLPNIVQVYDEQFPAGMLIRPTASVNGTLLHHGKVKRWVSNAMEAPDDPLLCWIIFVDDYDNAVGNVPARNFDYYGPARLCGVSTADGMRRPVYLVRANETPLVFFELREPKDLGTRGPWEAEILEWNGATWAASGILIHVYDWYRGALDKDDTTIKGFFTGKDYMDRGWAKFYQPPPEVGAKDNYIIMWMSGPAHITEFVLGANRTPGDPALEESVDASLLRSYLYGHEYYVPEAGNTQVRFPHTYFPFAKIGARGTAIYDDESVGNRRYRVVQCDQLCQHAVAILSGPLCGEVSATVEEFDNATPFPFSQVPPEVSTGGALDVLNLYQHRGEAGDLVWLEFIQYLEEYVITDVVKKNMSVSEPPFLGTNSDGEETLQFYCAILAVEYCNPPAICFEIALNECLPVSGGSG